MSTKLRFGVLSAANIGVKKVIPAMQQGELTAVTAIASRDLARARDAAAKLGIPTAYGAYEELLADPNIDAIYNPLPNQLHVSWTAKAAEAGKHVLCEKPLSMTVAETKTLLDVRARTGVKICEAFMIRSAPQWLRVRELLDEGAIGELRAVNAHFSYFNVDPANVRNKLETGGGALYDIGCYCIQAARYGFGREPSRVVSLIDRDPKLQTDRLTSAILDFGSGNPGSGDSGPGDSGPAQAVFTCSTQLIPYQRVHLFGTRGRIEIEIPVNTPPDRPTRIFIDRTGDLTFSGIATETFPAADQYTLQGDAFARAVRDNTEVPVPLEDSIGNMAVIEAIFRSGKSGQWETVQR
ncbi:MAG TPA: Gfo/Idh/MocA family oxidoreductase [Terracidiphilus sp.]|jgi:predicted dehydrogenase